MASSWRCGERCRSCLVLGLLVLLLAVVRLRARAVAADQVHLGATAHSQCARCAHARANPVAMQLAKGASAFRVCTKMHVMLLLPERVLLPPGGLQPQRSSGWAPRAGAAASSCVHSVLSAAGGIAHQRRALVVRRSSLMDDDPNSSEAPARTEFSAARSAGRGRGAARGSRGGRAGRGRGQGRGQQPSGVRVELDLEDEDADADARDAPSPPQPEQQQEEQQQEEEEPEEDEEVSGLDPEEAAQVRAESARARQQQWSTYGNAPGYREPLELRDDDPLCVPSSSPLAACCTMARRVRSPARLSCRALRCAHWATHRPGRIPPAHVHGAAPPAARTLTPHLPRASSCRLPP